MQICCSVAELRAALREVPVRQQVREQVGFVPTMGALHDGHAALFERARAECGFVVASIFVNPKQFGDAADLERYPRTPDEDARIAQDAGCDLLFCPTPEEMYPPGAECAVHPGAVAEGYEGAFRPGHFEGVCLVVCKLFHLVGPDRAYFGTKDAQQLAVVRSMVRDLDFAIDVVGVETVRAPDGLALSSRNRRLGAQGRVEARGLHEGLQRALTAFREGERDPETLAKTARSCVMDAGSSVMDARSSALDYEYCACVDPTTFGPPQDEFLLVLAATVDGVRLIDNLLLTAAPAAPFGGESSREG